MAVSREVLWQIDELQSRYVASLDAKRFDDWLNTFSEDDAASYICTTAENVEGNLPLALILDDCRARLYDRVTFVTKIWEGTYTDYRTRHFVQRIACREIDREIFEVESNFMVAWTPADTSRPEIFANGVYRDRVQVSAREARFISKMAITDNAIVQRYMVFPL